MFPSALSGDVAIGSPAGLEGTAAGATLPDRAGYPDRAGPRSAASSASPARSTPPCAARSATSSSSGCRADRPTFWLGRDLRPLGRPELDRGPAGPASGMAASSPGPSPFGDRPRRARPAGPEDIQTFYLVQPGPNLVFHAAGRHPGVVPGRPPLRRPRRQHPLGDLDGPRLDLHGGVDRRRAEHRRARRAPAASRSTPPSWPATPSSPTPTRRWPRWPPRVTAARDEHRGQGAGARGVARPGTPATRPTSRRCRPGPTPSTSSSSATARGYCEQISTPLAVMLRTLGIPAREATGYVPGPLQPDHRPLRRPGQGRPRLGAGVVPGVRLAELRPDRVGAGRQPLAGRRPSATTPSRALAPRPAGCRIGRGPRLGVVGARWSSASGRRRPAGAPGTVHRARITPAAPPRRGAPRRSETLAGSRRGSTPTPPPPARRPGRGRAGRRSPRRARSAGAVLDQAGRRGPSDERPERSPGGPVAPARRRRAGQPDGRAARQGLVERGAPPRAAAGRAISWRGRLKRSHASARPPAVEGHEAARRGRRRPPPPRRPVGAGRAPGSSRRTDRTRSRGPGRSGGGGAAAPAGAPRRRPPHARPHLPVLDPTWARRGTDQRATSPAATTPSAREQGLVADHPVVEREPRALQPGHLGHHPDARHHHVGLELGAVGEPRPPAAAPPGRCTEVDRDRRCAASTPCGACSAPSAAPTVSPSAGASGTGRASSTVTDAPRSTTRSPPPPSR